MVSDNTRSELVARLSIVDSQMQVLGHELENLRDTLSNLADEQMHLDALVRMYDKDKAWSKN